jgi:DNA adenine methylase
MISSSPLRYPGGKQFIAPLLAQLIAANGLEGKSYGEAYAGGAGAALQLLFAGHVKRVFINDADPAVAAMWFSITEQPDDFVKLIKRIPLTVAEWRKQRDVYQKRDGSRLLELGFATFYLNRVNRSGIVKNAGPIGGLQQLGKWKIDARFNRDALAERVTKVGRYRKKIVVTNLDALDFLSCLTATEGVFLYLDPPYYVKGPELYLNHYKHSDHCEMAEYLQSYDCHKWVLSYDDVPQIRRMYANLRKLKFDLSYSVHSRKVGKEVLIVGDEVVVPSQWKAKLPV